GSLARLAVLPGQAVTSPSLLRRWNPDRDTPAPLGVHASLRLEERDRLPDGVTAGTVRRRQRVLARQPAPRGKLAAHDLLTELVSDLEVERAVAPAIQSFRHLRPPRANHDRT